MNNQDSIIVHPSATAPTGTVSVPGDKSVSHRAAMLAALAPGTSVIENFLVSEDCLNTLRAVETLGASVLRDGLHVEIVGLNGCFRAAARALDMGNSGTGLRLLAGLLAGHPFVTTLTGDTSLRSRPMRRIGEPLTQMKCAVDLLGENGCAPMRIRGGHLQGMEYRLPVASAQVKSCVLLAGLFAEGRTTVIEPLPTRDHTEIVLRRMGVPVDIKGSHISVEGTAGEPLTLQSVQGIVPGDFSSAAFWITAAACRPGAELTVRHVGLNPRRTALLNVLRRMGADIEAKPDPDAAHGDDGPWECTGQIVVRGRALSGTETGGADIPNLIDELPLIGVAGALAEGPTVIRDAAELRVKESDRIATLAQGLSAFGVDVEEHPDGLTVYGGSGIRGGGAVNSHGDHRIAMAMAMLALFADAPARIDGVACTATSYPGFWDALTELGGVANRVD